VPHKPSLPPLTASHVFPYGCPVYVLAKPAVGAAYDPLLAQKLELELKEKLLAEFDPARKAVAEDEAGDILSNKTLFRVINNIQVRHHGAASQQLFFCKKTPTNQPNANPPQLTVERIHVRYEDTTPGAAFGIGLSLASVSAKSADEHWRACEVGVDPVQARKLVALAGLQVYWQCNLGPGDVFASSGKMAMDRFAKTFNSSLPGVILGPVEASGRLALNKNANLETPRLNTALDISALSVHLTDRQYAGLLGFAEYLTWLSRKTVFRHLRPHTTLADVCVFAFSEMLYILTLLAGGVVTAGTQGGSAAEWWKFAFHAVAENQQKRHIRLQWSVLAARRDMRKQYVALYGSLVAGNKATPEAKSTLAIIERQAAAHDILLWRKIALSRNPKLEKSTGLLSSFFGSGASKKQTDAEQLEQSRKELAKLLATDRDFESVDHLAFVSVHASVAIASTALVLRRHTSTTPLLHVALHQPRLDVSLRPNGGGAIAVAGHVSRLSMQLCRVDGTLRECVRPLALSSTPPVSPQLSPQAPRSQTKTPLGATKVKVVVPTATLLSLLQPPASSPDGLGPDADLFVFACDTRPLPKPDEAVTPDLRVRAALLPVEIVLSSASLARLVSFFAVPELKGLANTTIFESAAGPWLWGCGCLFICG
jgi:hypothetical protein